MNQIVAMVSDILLGAALESLSRRELAGGGSVEGLVLAGAEESPTVAKRTLMTEPSNSATIQKHALPM